MNIKKIITASATALLLTSALPTFAEGSYYIGAQITSFGLEQSGTTNADLDVDPQALTLIGGYKFNEHIAIEGRFGFDAGDDEGIEVDQAASILGKFSLGGNVSPYLLVGFSDVEFEDSFGATRTVDEVAFGVGVDFNVSESSAITLEYIDHGDSDVPGGGTAELESLSLGFNYSF